MVSGSSPRRTGANKLSDRWDGRAASKKEAEILGELQYKILTVAVYVLKLRRFFAREVYNALKAMGYSISRTAVYKSLRRLVERGMLVRLGSGCYELTDKAYEALEKYRVLGGLRYVTKLNKSCERVHGKSTSPPHDRDSSKQSCQDPPQTHQSDQSYRLLEPGIYFDNVRGVIGGRYVNGDRGRFLRAVDLEVFDRIDYAEIRYATGTDWLRNRGVIVIYFSCGEISFTGEMACSDVIEWRPPEGYYKHKTVLDARREFREMLLILDALALRATDDLMGLEGVARAVRRELKRGGIWARELLKRLCRAYPDRS